MPDVSFGAVSLQLRALAEAGLVDVPARAPPPLLYREPRRARTRRPGARADVGRRAVAAETACGTRSNAPRAETGAGAGGPSHDRARPPARSHRSSSARPRRRCSGTSPTRRAGRPGGAPGRRSIRAPADASTSAIPTPSKRPAKSSRSTLRRDCVHLRICERHAGRAGRIARQHPPRTGGARNEAASRPCVRDGGGARRARAGVALPALGLRQRRRRRDPRRYRRARGPVVRDLVRARRSRASRDASRRSPHRPCRCATGSVRWKARTR